MRERERERERKQGNHNSESDRNKERGMYMERQLDRKRGGQKTNILSRLVSNMSTID